MSRLTLPPPRKVPSKIGIHIERQVPGTGLQPIGITILSLDSEGDNTGGSGAGVHCIDCLGFTLTSANIVNSHGHGLWLDGDRGMVLNSGEVKGSTNIGINVIQSGAPSSTFPGGIINQGMLVVGSGSSNTGGVALNSAYSLLGFDGTNAFFDQLNWFSHWLTELTPQ